MTFKHKIKFILAVLKGDVNKVTEIEKPIFVKTDFKETMNLQSYIFNRKKYLEGLSFDKTQDKEGEEDLEERDQEYQQLEEIEKLQKTWQKTKI